jgi:ABC-type antimicrobial peptide transport system permease subunit
VFGLVLTDGLKITGIGLSAGLVGSVFLGQAMEKQLFNVSPMNPMVVMAVTLTLSCVALLAVSIPAVRASRINPAVVLGK